MDSPIENPLNMIQHQHALINEQSSPLFRMMWIHNANEPLRRHFDNNICAFHIGNGYVLSVAHNLKSEAMLFKSIPQDIFASSILPHLNVQQRQIFEQCYPLDPLTRKRYIHITQPNDFQWVVDTLKQINWDTRWLSLTERNFCQPFLIVQFKNPLFYNDPKATALFDAQHYFYEASLNRHTFLLDIELIEAFYSADIALYKIINTSPDIIQKLPYITPDFSILPDNCQHYYCLQSAPGSELGKLLNKAQIEGYLEHFGTFMDPVGGHYHFEGLRYMIKGYFRFGSSGAPYVFFDEKSQTFKVNAIQSEACPIQLSIQNNREGNLQFVNALASPLQIIESEIRKHCKPGK